MNSRGRLAAHAGNSYTHTTSYNTTYVHVISTCIPIHTNQHSSNNNDTTNHATINFKTTKQQTQTILLQLGPYNVKVIFSIALPWLLLQL